MTRVISSFWPMNSIREVEGENETGEEGDVNGVQESLKRVMLGWGLTVFVLLCHLF